MTSDVSPCGAMGTRTRPPSTGTGVGIFTPSCQTSATTVPDGWANRERSIVTATSSSDRSHWFMRAMHRLSAVRPAT